MKKKKKKKTEDENYIPKAFRKDKKEQKKKGNKSKEDKEKKINKKTITIISIICILIVIILGIYLGISTHRWKMLAKEMVAFQNSTVLDSDGKEIAKLGCSRKNEPIKLDEVQDNLKNAYIAIEDERFYKHGGIDVKRTGGAIVSYITHFGKSSYGGSTITQQLVKNLTGDNTDSITRKVKEWWKAEMLETELSKDEVLEAYLNIIYVGPHMYGVEVGSQYYFNKSASELNLEECAFLAGMNNSPNSYNPFGEKDNSEKIKKRTKTVLKKMLDLNYIDETSYNTAVNNVDNGLKFKKGNVEADSAVYSYHTDALILQITEDIAKKYNISTTFATNYINMAGLTVYSTQNTKIQETTEKEFEKSKYQIQSKKEGGSPSQAAMAIIDHKTGKVLGCVGGLGEKTEVRPLNRATQSVRQTGSSIKPLSVLIPSIDKKIITAASIYDDSEKDFANGYHPTDYNKPLGEITVRRAVESSQNIPFVEIMQQLKPATAIEYLKKMGITSLTKEDETLVLALGGLQKGISPLEMAAGYAMIANDGLYIEPTFYTSVNNSSQITIVKAKQKRKRVVSREVAYIVKEILTQPVQGSKGTASYCKISGVDVSAKTGTTDENYDRWLCGFTPYYTAATWYGFDENETIEFNKRNPAGLLWANVMSKIHAGLKSATFEKPNSVYSCNICADTGKVATTGCKNVYTEYFLRGTVPQLCDKHSGTELKQENTEKDQNKQDTVQNITHDIDAVDPQQVDIQQTQTTTSTPKTTTNQNETQTNKNNTMNTTNTTNNKTENTNKNTTNVNANTNTNTNSNTNTSTNSNTNTTNNSNTNTNSSTSNNTNNTTKNTNTNMQ